MDLKLFARLAQMNQSELRKVLFYFLRKKYHKVVHNKNYIYAVGEIPIALVAHMDTVFDKPPQKFYCDEKQSILFSPQGLGADDRAGIYAIIQIIKSGLRPHIIFASDEEKGAIGASALGEIDCPFSDLRYIIELDRNGYDDCVFYNCDNRDFVTYIEGFGFKESWGSFSDISAICPKWGVAGVNLSIGYKNEHSFSEILNYSWMEKTIKKVRKMLTVDKTEIPYFKYIHRYEYHYSSKYKVCTCCNELYPREEMIELDNSIQYCIDCLITRGEWCHNCGTPFIKPNAWDTQTLCEKCRKE